MREPVSEPPRIAILLYNLGTPDAPTTPAVRRYLAEFLSDPRIVELPRLLWLPILYGFVLLTRPAQSAKKYASIWMKEGSPLEVWTQRQAKLLQGWLGHHGHQVKVVHAMRYAQPNIAKTIDKLRKQGVSHILALPAYPQYSCTTTASVMDSIAAWNQAARHLPEWRHVNRYFDHPLYIKALAKRVQKHWQHHGQGQMLVMSYHGVPERTRQLGDPYFDECHATSRLLAAQLGLSQQQYVVTFQSRFGRAKWLQPYTAATLEQLAQKGQQRVDVICPGFVSDCIETLEEINIEGREIFLHAGGKEFHYIPCLNDSPAWIDALGAISLQHLAGWVGAPQKTSPKSQFLL
ncbi:MAG: ferrochelatase [Brachymonas sp.]|nr:ferrochelatase [Brachymonas sp.]